jgi:hypothetical protein
MENILINIDSRFRNKKIFPNPGNYTYFFNDPFKNISYIRLSSIELPNMYYSFNIKYLNTFFSILFEDNIFTVTIPDGNYTSDVMINKIQEILSNINSSNSTNFSISWDNINYKISFYNSAPFSLKFSNDSNILHNLGYYLGFRYSDDNYLSDNQETKYLDGALLYYWTSNTFLDVTKDEYLFLKINDYGIIYNDFRDKRLLAKIIMFDTQYIVDNGSNFLTKMYKFKQPVNISKLDIELISPLGYTIDMNDIDFSFTLEIGQIYDSNLLESLNENYIFKNNYK